MTTSTIRHEAGPRGITTLTLDRPDTFNAFNRPMLVELEHLLDTIAADDSVRVLVLRGAGKHFSSGADVSPPKPGEQSGHHGFIECFVKLDAFPKPTIAVVHGACVGGAAALVTCCDLVIATETAFFSVPEVRIGFAPVGVTPMLVRAMGLRAYRRYAMSGERIPAAEARHHGLADDVVAATGLEEHLDQRVDAFLHGAPKAQAQLKAHLVAAYPQILDEMARAHDHHVRENTFRTPEAVEGIEAFVKQRKPSWYPPR